MLRRHVADVAADHLFLGQRLLPVLLRAVIIVVVHHSPAAVVPELRRRYLRSLQVAVQIFDAPPGPAGFLCKVDLPVASVLRLQIAQPLFLVANVPQSQQATGVNQVIAVAQQTDNGAAPDFLHGLLLKEDVPPDAMFYIQAATGDGEVNVRMLVELSAVGVQCTEDTDFHVLFSGPAEHGARGGAE